MRIEAEKYFEDAVPQSGTILGTPDIISKAKGKIPGKPTVKYAAKCCAPLQIDQLSQKAGLIVEYRF